jgi:hypothetical protein
LWECILPQIVLAITAECDEFQQVRIGKSWIKSRSGRIKPIRPVTLPPHQYSKWVRQQAYRRLREYITEGHWCRQDLWVPIGDYDVCSLMPHVDALIAAEHVKDVPSPLIEELTNRLPRKQRQYLRILLNSLTEYETVSEARKKTTRRLKITSVYERQLWCRTRKLIQSVHTF